MEHGFRWASLLLVVAVTTAGAAFGASRRSRSASFRAADAFGPAAAGSAQAAAEALSGGPGVPHEFFFTRAVYTDAGRSFFFRGGGSWATDYPKSDLQFLTVLTRLVDIDAYPEEHPVRLDDPDLRRFPFLYTVEVGRGMRLTDAEADGLRSYLMAGGFLVVDDFWGSREWANFEREIRKVFPERPIVELPMDHPVFHMVYPIPEILQVPNVNNGVNGPPYSEQDGYVPHARGIFDDDGRLMVMINWNTDLGDAWEWAENPYYPLDRSTYAFQMGVNMIVYAMSH